jgi:2-C-methyl-D-erythritol 4-phosphate cytidylyltransferase
LATFAVILPAAGRSTRFRDPHFKKPFAPLENRAVWVHCAERFVQRDDVQQTVLVIAPEDRDYFDQKFGGNAALLGVQVVEGGAERADSVERALRLVRAEIDFVAVHDAARPCLAEAWITQVFQAAEKSGAAILALPVAGTLKRVTEQRTIQETVSRERLWEAQTPQVFARALLIKAYASRNGFNATDDAQLVERIGHAVTVVTGSAMNFKITTQDDLRMAAQVLKALPKPRLDGPGHPFAEDIFR